ncbi:hypothetical protein [Bradyrhizobium sp. CCBAU 21362]|uniref:hypothetical protein n=1 Tax=Bradyrhizobium sp. CCBAU 21362 TaxID=1325082 RepID=UPI0023068E7F|nr:hypothetical protein [Bradyrhizobium sp. CCBAU 21362]
MMAPVHRTPRRLNPKKGAPGMQADPVRAPFHFKVEDGTVIGRWDYRADVKFTDAEIAQLDGPEPKFLYLDITGGRAATRTFVALSAATATTALKAIAERVDKMSTVYVPADAKGNFAEVRRLAAIADCANCYDDDAPHHFTVHLLTDDPEAVEEYIGCRPRKHGPFTTEWPRCTAPIAVSIADSVAAVTIEPRTAELSEETKAAIVAADMQRVFVDARGLKPVDYPQESLAFLFSNATLICASALDCRKSSAEDDIDATHAIFDAHAEESPWVVRLFTNSPREWSEFIEKHRPLGGHCLMWPTYDPEPAAG